ncbi:dihydroorotase [Synechocystis sp. PCC 7509]|uniref:dihydroorotase n=1 Tax=Synechocystis sp. PCC 7509 TaxID=927677 RepID=UPI0002ABAF31|nr:dihydroorotase [Synechocystis sp. PCC 7509]
MTSELLQQVRVIDPVAKSDRIADVEICDGVIKAVQDNISEWSNDTQVRDCRGLVLGAGLIDLYSHSGEPGFETRETLSSLLEAAAAGGFTRLCILPDTMPILDNLAAIALIQQKRRELTNPLPKMYVWGALTIGVQGQQMTELAELAKGSVGFADGKPVANLALLRRLLEYLKPVGKPVALWCCDRQLVGNGVMREGTDSIILGLPGNPHFSETTAIAAVIELVAAIGTPVHIMRVSTARSVQLIAQAKAQGLPITASSSWMHLLLDTKSHYNYDPNLRLEPPLGNPRDRLALLEGVRSGVIDAIALDLAPYTYEEKTVAFAEAPPGVIGFELALGLLWQQLVANGQWSALELWRSISLNPANCLQQTIKEICPGNPAELTLFAPQLSWLVEAKTLKSLATNTPWLGQKITGRVVQTWVT